MFKSWFTSRAHEQIKLVRGKLVKGIRKLVKGKLVKRKLVKGKLVKENLVVCMGRLKLVQPYTRANKG